MKTLFAVLFAFALCNSSVAGSFDGAPLHGEVLETMDAGSYTYLRLKTSDGEIWAAIMRTPIATGAHITIQDPMLMTDFESKSLHKTFDKIVFGSVVDTGEGQSPAAAHAAAHAAARVATAAVDGPVDKVARAAGPNALTVEEIVVQKMQLAGKPVVVRGQVVKFSPGIMDRNWVHLRDGSGAAADQSNDLLVTTNQVVAVGDIVVAQGLVRTDADFGAGYSYAVLLENATLQK